MSSPKINLAALEKAHWSVEDRKNAQQVVEFVQLLMNDHNFAEITRRYTG